MSAADATGALHPQDRLLIVEALTYWASGHGPGSEPADTADRRKHRAARLAEALLDDGSVEREFREAIDTEWDGTEGTSLAATGSSGGEPDEADA
jgi:hypothetical protein